MVEKAFVCAPEGSRTPNLPDLQSGCSIQLCTLKCAPEGSRTPNLLIRSQVLYPIKLQVPFLTDCKNMLSFQTNISFLKIVSSISSMHSRKSRSKHSMPSGWRQNQEDLLLILKLLHIKCSDFHLKQKLLF